MTETKTLFRPVSEPVRENISRCEMWEGDDGGLIWCWELGRLFRQQTDQSRRLLVSAAERGELPVSDWRGGVKEKLKAKTKVGSLQYLAQWQGMRGEDLNIDLEKPTVLTCSRTGQSVVFTPWLTDDEEA